MGHDIDKLLKGMDLIISLAFTFVTNEITVDKAGKDARKKTVLWWSESVTIMRKGLNAATKRFQKMISFSNINS